MALSSLKYPFNGGYKTHRHLIIIMLGTRTYLYICICLVLCFSFEMPEAKSYIVGLIIIEIICAMKINELRVDQLELAANMLKAIAHPMRIAILTILEDGNTLTVTEIHEQLGIEQSTTSHHLGILKDKGVLASRREGKNTYYFLKHPNLGNIVGCVSECTEP